MYLTEISENCDPTWGAFRHELQIISWNHLVGMWEHKRLQSLDHLQSVSCQPILLTLSRHWLCERRVYITECFAFQLGVHVIRLEHPRLRHMLLFSSVLPIFSVYLVWFTAKETVKIIFHHSFNICWLCHKHKYFQHSLQSESTAGFLLTESIHLLEGVLIVDCKTRRCMTSYYRVLA